MGDQDMATFDDADWSEDSHMDECDSGAPLTVQTSSDRYPDYSHDVLCIKLPYKSFLMTRRIVRNLTMV